MISFEALTGSTEAWGGLIRTITLVALFHHRHHEQDHHCQQHHEGSRNLRCDSDGDEAPEPDERDMVSVQRANLTMVIMIRRTMISCKDFQICVISIKGLGGNFRSIGSCCARYPLLRGFRMTCDPERPG